MKKVILICAFALCFSGCSLQGEPSSVLDSQNHFQIEEDASLHIRMDDNAYASAIRNLWDTTFPKHKGVLSIYCDTFKDFSTYDIDYLQDTQIAKRKEKLYNIEHVQEHIELPVEDYLQKDEDYFLPVDGRGLVFLYNEEALIARGGSIQNMESFESMKSLGNHVYYHNRNAEYVYPFLHTEEDQEEDTWYENLEAYRNLNKDNEFLDDQYEMSSFYKDGYICGLVQNNGTYQLTDLYRKGKLHFRSMPTYHSQSFSPIVDTYGFVVYKTTKYPGAASAFLQLVRSESGMKLLLKHTSKTPLIAKKALEDFFVYDRSRKELMEALNESQLRNSKILAKMKKENFYSTIQNAMYTKESNESFIKKMKDDIESFL